MCVFGLFLVGWFLVFGVDVDGWCDVVLGDIDVCLGVWDVDVVFEVCGWCCVVYEGFFLFFMLWFRCLLVCW